MIGLVSLDPMPGAAPLRYPKLLPRLRALMRCYFQTMKCAFLRLTWFSPENRHRFSSVMAPSIARSGVAKEAVRRVRLAVANKKSSGRRKFNSVVTRPENLVMRRDSSKKRSEHVYN